MKGSEAIFEDQELPSLEVVEGSASSIRQEVLSALGSGGNVTIRLRSGQTFESPIREIRQRPRHNELQVKLVGDTFSLILRISYDDSVQVTAEKYDFQYRDLIPEE